MIFSFLSILVNFSEQFLDIYLSSCFRAICMRHIMATPKKLPAIRPRKNCSIMFSSQMHFMVKRIKTTKSALLRSADQRYHDVFKGKTDGGGASRSVGYVFRASLHAYGGTFDSVTCHQRRYHYACLRIVASSRAVGCIQRWCCSLCRRSFTSLPTDNPGAPAAWLPASRTYLLALFTCLLGHRPVKAHRSRCALADR